MSDPTVCAVLLTADRPEMWPRAVKSFMAQTYGNKRLLLFDTSTRFTMHSPIGGGNENVVVFDGNWPRESRPATIGELRNAANRQAVKEFSPDILLHFDDDDISHKSRMTEQVALLQESRMDCVGYNEVLFWREDANGMDALSEAWLYSNGNPAYALGASLCYWRRAWEARPFEPTSQGEDRRWIAGVRSLGVSGKPVEAEPRLVCRIHSGNTSNAYANLRGPEWRRVPEWDTYARGIFEA